MTTDLHGHHHPLSLEEIYEQSIADGLEWSVFVAMACDPDQVISTCAAHNNALDAARRKARA